MKINILLYITVIITSLGFYGATQAQNPDNTYKRMANTSTKIIQGRIIGREEIRFDYDDDNLNVVCGQLLEIEVTKSWKGGNERFKVFSQNSDILMGGEMEYFMFARINRKYGKTGLAAIDFINCDEGRSARMDISNLEFLATRLRQQIFPLVKYDSYNKVMDEDTHVMKRGEWMMIVNRIANSALPYTIMRRRLNNGNENIIEEMSLRNFLDEFISD